MFMIVATLTALLTSVAIEIPIPEPPTLKAVFWFLLAISAGQSFKDIDYDIQESDWYKALGSFTQRIIKHALDFLHHWWMGLFLAVYAEDIAFILGGDPVIFYWFGWGLFVDDMPDVPKRHGILIGDDNDDD